jgi:ESS family glutamate:Na+ symporter
MTRYPGELVVLLFATLFMGWRTNRPRFREMIRDAGDTFFYNLSAWIGQFGLALLFAGAVLIPLFREVGGPFALMLPAGFVGGHGTAAAVGSILAEQGYDHALPVGYTFATIGLLAAVLGGVAAINLATRSGWTRLVSTPRELPADQRRGLIDPDAARHVGKETVSPLALDTLSWHVALVLLAYGAAHAVAWVLRSAGGTLTAVPMFGLAVICGAVIQTLLDALGVGRHVDRPTIGRIGSSISDYLVAFGVASIPLTIVAEYAAPILVMSVFGFAYAIVLTLWVARRTFHNYWFERGLFTFGWATGVVAMGIALLRVVDPKRKSTTLDDYGLAYIPIAVVEIAVISTLPLWIARGAVWLPGLALTAAAAGLLLISWRTVGFFPSDPVARRTGEPAVGPATSPRTGRAG